LLIHLKELGLEEELLHLILLMTILNDLNATNMKTSFTNKTQTPNNNPNPTINNNTRQSQAVNRQSTRPNVGGDLDSIMDGLNKFVPSGNNVSQNARDSTTPLQQGICASCRKPIQGDIVQALGKQYHPDHFICTSCGTVLGSGNFYEQEGQPQCENCFHNHFCMTCAACNLPITNQVINALNANWHPNCFNCTNCLGPFHDGAFFEKDGRPFCSTCFSAVFAPRCKACNQTIVGQCINAIGAQWHAEHFVCQFCKRPFPGGLFFEIGGQPYCEAHYQIQQQKLVRGISTN